MSQRTRLAIVSLISLGQKMETTMEIIMGIHTMMSTRMLRLHLKTINYSLVQFDLIFIPNLNIFLAL